MNAAPDLYPLNDDELADELHNIDATHPPIELQGPVAVTVGLRRDPASGLDHPVVVVRGADGLHLLALPGEGAAS